MKRRRLVLGFASAAMVAWALPGSAMAQTYPTKPIKLIVPFAPGGTTDIVGRIVAQKMSETLGQQVVVENKAGAGGSIGAAEIAKATPDGYTIGIASVSTHGTNPAVTKNLRYDAFKDFVPITQLVTVPGIIVVHKTFPAKDYKSFLDHVKANPGKYPYASSGAAGVGHLSMELFEALTSTKMTHVPYKGAGPALNDVIGGQVPIMWDNLSSSLPHIKAGTLVPIGLAYDKRIPQLPDVPTFAELGLPKYETTTWFGLVAPAGTPKPIIDKLYDAAIKAVKNPDVAKRFEETGAFPSGTTSEEFQKIIKTEIDKWKEVAQRGNIQLTD